MLWDSEIQILQLTTQIGNMLYKHKGVIGEEANGNFVELDKVLTIRSKQNRKK
jgi:hypothetical protein